MKEYKVKTDSLEETHQLGEILGRNAMANMVFLLDGDLGAGKTTLTQGIAKGLDIHKNVTSPTFTIQKIYHGRLPLYHIDAYRLEGVDQDLGFEEYFYDDGSDRN
jgi:tRNA threonylcarbamoyladenosine biosynthesis protein TsaE